MGTSYANSDALALRWPSLPASQYTEADQLCADASVYLRTQYPGIDTQQATDADLADVLEIVVCNIVKRQMLTVTPGVSQESTGTGPYNHSVTYSNPMQNLFLTAGEDAMIRGYQPRGQSVSMAEDVSSSSSTFTSSNGAVVTLP